VAVKKKGWDYVQKGRIPFDEIWAVDIGVLTIHIKPGAFKVEITVTSQDIDENGNGFGTCVSKQEVRYLPTVRSRD
jgi:hypothetical protein